MTKITIDSRFRGPPNTGNGGYVCGLLARHIGPSAEVTLRKPPPLEVPLTVAPADDETVALLEGETVIATGKAIDFEIAPLPNPSFSEAQQASTRTPYTVDSHYFPMCFVCGPEREPGDGLRIFAGPLESGDTAGGVPFASHWLPLDSLLEEDGLVGEEFVWASLDCPTGYAIMGSGLEGTRGSGTIFLGRMAVRIAARPRQGERCVITAKAIGRDGRKLFADGTLFGEDGTACAVAHTTWILVEHDVA